MTVISPNAALLARHRQIKLSVIGRKSGRTISAVSAVLLPLANLFRDPRSGLADIVVLGLLLELSRFPHYPPGAVFEGFGPFAFLPGLLTVQSVCSLP
jgi:hypothetical protein